MTEEQWLSSADPLEMFNFLYEGSRARLGRTVSHPISERKKRRWVEACREVLSSRISMPIEWGSLDGPGMLDECVESWSKGLTIGNPQLPLAERADMLRDVVGNPFRPVMRVGKDWGLFMHHDKHLLIFESWLTPTVMSLAEACYEERLEGGILDPARLAVLSDALEEAGCADEKCDACGGRGECDVKNYHGAWETWGCSECGGTGGHLHPILAHLRSPGPKYRGMWSLDLLLQVE